MNIDAYSTCIFSSERVKFKIDSLINWIVMTKKSVMIAATGSAIEECARIGIESGAKYHKIVNSGKKFQAVCSGTALTIYGASSTFAEDAIKADLEFDHELVGACWDLMEGCVIVADVNGSLHLVTTEGALLFSKKIVADGIISGIKFVSNFDQSEVQTLVVVVDNGTIFCIQNMYVAAICKEQGSALGGLLQKLQVQKHALTLASKISSVYISELFVEDSVEISLVYTDTSQTLYTVSLGVATSVAVETPRILAEGKVCTDFYVTGTAQGAQLCLALLDEENLAVIDLEEEESLVVTSSKLASKAQRIISVAHSSTVISGSEEEITSFILVLAPHVLSGSEGVTTQTIWVGRKAQDFKVLQLSSAPLPPVLSAGQKAEIVRAEGEAQHAVVLMITGQDLICLQPSAPLRFLEESIASTVTQFAANISAPTTPAGVLVDQALQGLGASAQVHTVSYFDQCVQRFGLMTSGNEILALLTLLLEIPQPPTGYLQKFLYHAEMAVEKVSTKQNQSAKQRWLLEILKLHHSLETAQLLLNLTPSVEEPEEALRKGLLALLPDNIANTLRLCLRSGRLRHALLITQRCVRGALPIEPAETVQRIPDDCALEDFIAWVRHGVVERLSLFNATSPSVGALAVAGELLKRAEVAEETTGSPFVAVRLVELAKELTSSIPYSISATSKEIIEQVSTLHAALELQLALWERWEDEVRLEEVTSLGLQGLVFDRIDTMEEEKLIDDLRSNVLPLIRQFKDDGDQLLRGWIEETISTRIVLAGDEAARGVEESESCTLSRLVKVASVIEDRNVQAKMVLTLLQMPVLEEMSLRDGRPVVLSEDDIDGNGVTEEAAVKRTAGTNHLASTRLLCDLAAAASDFVDGATREALTEATRLLRIKSVAASYGIESFEPRNGKQVRSVVILIANTMHRAESIRDAVEFSSSWGNSSVDMKAVLTRAIILRSTNLPLFLSQGGKFETNLRSSLSFLPSEVKQIVCEDAVAFLLEELVEEADSIQFEPGQSCSAEVTETKRRAEMLMRAAVVLCSHYLDVTREEADEIPPAVTGSSAPKRIRSHELQEGSINSDLLQLLKRILTLQTAHDIFVSHIDIGDKDVCQAIITKLAKFRVNTLLQEVVARPETDGPKVPLITAANAPLDTPSRKVCLLLNVLPTFFTHTAMKLLVEASQTDLAMELAASLSREKSMHSSSLPLMLSTASDGLTLNSNGSESKHGAESDDEAEREASLLLDAAVTLCAIAAKKANQISAEEYPMLPSLSLSTAESVIEMPEYLSFPMTSFSLSRDLLRCSVSGCPSMHLGRTLDLLSGSETVLAVYDRIEGAASQLEEDRSGVSTVLAEGVFARDGILMQASSVAMPLMKYSFAEIKRRSTTHSRSAPGASGSESAPDLEDLVRILQRSENHLLATRILLGSWHSSQAKANLLRSSLLSLCRKVLIYRDIDIPFAVASLAALSYDTMVKELKTAVPSIQSDFSRLQTVALVGEELSHLWDQEQLLMLFQGLQTNAKWWHILSSLGLKVDLRVFQSPDAEVRDKVVRSLIPELFEKGNMDLEMVTEYCRQFDLEPEYATLTYVDLLFTARPTVFNDFSWAGKVRSAAERVEDRAILQRLREVLPRIHPLDYEKVRYVCTWLIDLLSAEEGSDEQDRSNYPEDHEDHTTSFSLKSKAQKVTTAALQAERGSSHELDTYRRYLEIAGYLAGLKFPVEATAAIQVAATPSPYDSVNASYRERIPLWQLLENPWSVLDPLLTNVPESAGKLAPLCLPLRLDKADFNFRKIMALYARMTNKVDIDITTSKAIAGHPMSVSVRESKRAALQATSEAIDASLTSPLQQLKLWQWIYDREVANGDDEHAMLALKSAFAVAVNHPTLVAPQETFGASSVEDSEGSSVHARLSNEMRALKCKLTVKQFNQSLMDSPGACCVLLGAVSDPALLLRCMFETVIEISWDMYVHGLHQLGAPVTAYTLAESSPNQQLLEFVDTATKAIEEIAQHCGQNQAVQTGDAQSQTTYLELSRHNMIGKMLSDVETNAQAAASGDRDASAASTAGIFASGQATAKRGFWGGADEATYAPSSAELRRREDVYLALSISVLVLTCASAAQRQGYFAQLDSVIRGKGVRVMRRLTARSKYRAAQSLFYLQSATLHSAPVLAELTSYKSYLYCLSELQEIRLPCSEESLLDAMNLKVVDFKMTTVNTGGDPKALVRTWIHDEGAHTEVVELARDLLVTTRYQDAGIWFHLVGHMVAKGMHRALLQSLLMVRGAAVFADMCFGMLGSDIIASLAKVCVDATGRAEQVLQLAAVRSNEAVRQCSDWLWINQQGAASVLTPVSTPTGTASSAAATSGTTKDSAAPHHRVLIRPRLAGRPGDWEEGAPEDLLPTLEQSVALSVAVLHQVSSRVRAKCDPAAASLRSSCAEMLALSVQALSGENGTGARNVSIAVSQALQQSGMALLTPVVFGGLEENAKNLELVGALNALYPVEGNGNGKVEAFVFASLCELCSKFDVAVVVNAVDKHLRAGASSVVADRLKFLLQVFVSGAGGSTAAANRASHKGAIAAVLNSLLENRLAGTGDAAVLQECLLDLSSAALAELKRLRSPSAV